MITSENLLELYPVGYVCNPNEAECDCELCEIVRLAQALKAELAKNKYLMEHGTKAYVRKIENERDRLKEALLDSKETILYCRGYVEDRGLSAEDDCNDSLEIIEQALNQKGEQG